MSNSYWVIEAMSNKYWNGQKFDRTGFTTKHSDAIRFMRKQDAETVRCWLFNSDIEALLASVEHSDLTKP